MTNFGKDIACVYDADELWSTVSGIDLVRQDALHRITCDSVLGPGGADWGYDVHHLLGASQQELTRAQPRLVEVLTRDPRIDSADVTLTALSATNFSISIRCQTAAGPFDISTTLAEVFP